MTEKQRGMRPSEAEKWEDIGTGGGELPPSFILDKRASDCKSHPSAAHFYEK